LGLALDFGVPLVIKSWDRVHVLFRPGFFYESREATASAPPAPFATSTTTAYRLSAELEAEVFVVNTVSVSASHGRAYEIINPPGPDNTFSNFGTEGLNFTDVGFHVYLLGGS